MATAQRTLRGVDFSTHQGRVDTALLARAVDFALFKTTEGADFIDPTWGGQGDTDAEKIARLRSRVAAHRQHGLPFAPYHFLNPKAGRSGAVEARFAIAVAKSAGWGHADDGILWCDAERTSLGRQATIRYIGEFRGECVRQGVEVGVYTFPHFWIDLLGNPGTLGFKHLWIANPGVPKPTVPAGFGDWTIWQDSFEGSVAGEKPIDTNRARRFPRLGAAKPKPRPKPLSRRQRTVRRLHRARRRFTATHSDRALRVFLISKARLGLWDPRYCLHFGPNPDVNDKVKKFVTRGFAAGLVPTSLRRAPRFPGDHSHHIDGNAGDMAPRRELAGTAKGMRRMLRFQASELKRARRTSLVELELIGPNNLEIILRGQETDLVEGTALEDQHDTHVHEAVI